nr:MAG TPA: hypothetical protein [Caudoviricetes sp.]
MFFSTPFFLYSFFKFFYSYFNLGSLSSSTASGNWITKHSFPDFFKYKLPQTRNAISTIGRNIPIRI